MKTYIIVAIVIIALLFVPFIRTILRWILFLPVALIAGVLFQYLDIPSLILSWLASMISPTLGLIFDVIDIFLGFFIITIIAKNICPSSKVGWYVSFPVCLLLSICNLIYYHVYALFPLGAWDPSSPTTIVIWWHIVILAVASFGGAWATYEMDND